MGLFLVLAFTGEICEEIGIEKAKAARTNASRLVET